MNAYSQEAVKKIKGVRVSKIISSIDTSIFIKSEKMGISIFRINNGSGSAGLPESDEVSHSFLLSVAEFDENPKEKVYCIGTFINPELLEKKDLNEKFIIQIKHGVYNNRKISNLIISLKMVTVE